MTEQKQDQKEISKKDVAARKKREKKEQKKKRNRDEDDEGNVSNEVEVEEVSQDNTDETKIIKSKELLKQRRLERQKLLDLVPKIDEHGISYTKQQIRLMRKRVQKGLHPIETSAEKHNRLVEEARVRKEVEAELAGYDGNNNDDESHGDGDDNNNDDDNVDSNSQKWNESDDKLHSQASHHDNGEDDVDKEDYSYEKRPSSTGGEPIDRRPIKKKKREKPVPSDYVCSACKGTDNDQSPHWIYDCLYKKTMPGTNQVSRKNRGLHDPLETKLFVSGLPFDSTIKDVTELFTAKIGNTADADNTGPVVVHCKLIKFEDTKRCKGQAFVTFATPEAAKKALKLNGTIIPASSAITTASSKKAKKDIGNTTTKELKLKITKVLNRTLTKK